MTFANSIELVTESICTRVKLLMKRGMAVEEISSIIGRGKRVVLEYVKLARQYHPELGAEAN